ncbi:hypothetical protein A0J57_09125 [Sphingobium sp. 22B]|uniref:TetR/AcrR family transcriptional regulator n=1 Tax=unclassified Sphingobium TaxID=2611147 RepID=UPI000782E087|nr:MULTISPECIES: TetR/AcrR family transcriptional regulator [unclassified Sphingobium]KXU32693.1 hypothetical protein AXW74_06615 [Sphingobium sp. AM]KYC32770.1 hypothetical protein A0J57_09125 [Sphingobium sp. 22B]OAP31661.1 hypothetical protein A8O16_12580 [Sphingobium sp. 20006FA]
MTAALNDSPASTERFAARRNHILEVGARMINERGLKGLSLGAVAEEIGIGGTGVTYYFKRKEMLAEACYDRSLDALEDQLLEAAKQPDLASRISRLIRSAFAELRRDGHERPRTLALLNEMRAMDDLSRARLIRRYLAVFRVARGFFDMPDTVPGKLAEIMRSHILLETVHDLPRWLERYAVEEYDRVADSLIDLLLYGISPDAAAPDPGVFSGFDEDASQRDRFLGAATMLMNERGYRGASVDRIAAALKVTKGSFYHHIDAKDDLVLACYRRSLDVIGHAQNGALLRPAPFLGRLANAFGSLISLQLGDGTPLLRSTALAALPPELMQEAVDRSSKVARRFAGMVIDGMADGSIRPVDPLIAGQYIMCFLNAAFELRKVSRRVRIEEAVNLYSSILYCGMAGPTPLADN